MRKHRIFGVVIATLFFSGGLTQLPSTAHADQQVGLQLVSHTKRTVSPPIKVVHAQNFMVARADPATNDKLLALSTYMKPPPPPPPPPPAPPPRTAPARSAPPPPPPIGNVWAALRQCESSGNYGDNTGNGYFGAYQFSEATWLSLGLSGRPSDAPPPVQDAAAQRLEARSGWSQWPACARRLGL